VFGERSQVSSNIVMGGEEDSVVEALSGIECMKDEVSLILTS
jgi:hypothetical protein